MLYYDRIDMSEGIDPSRSNKSREFMISHYWFFNYGFRFQYSVYNACHDFSILCLDITNIAIITVNNANYRCTTYNN